MVRRLDLGTYGNWGLLDTKTITAQPLPLNKGHQPIPTQTLSTITTSHVIAYLVGSSTGKPTWKFGGFFNQLYPIRINPQLGNTYAVRKQKLWQRQLGLVFVPQIIGGYQIEYEVPSWFPDVNFTFWEYLGYDIDTTEQRVEGVQSDITVIKADIQQIKTDTTFITSILQSLLP